jgi:tetratricopeptide (TPR) repeat protein
LLLAVELVFGQTAGFGFVNDDDSAGIYENRLVTGDLTWRGVLATFTERHIESWCPLTCVSHILVWHCLGHGAAAHHVVNALLHAATAVLLLLVLWRMTGRLWPSALAAALFAVHPLRAESVAWVTERKDVLSGLLFMLTLLAYLGYVRGGKKGTGTFCAKHPEGRSGKRCLSPFSLRYLIVLACFIAGLAAKPMAVTLPFLLLLLDYWPLGRMTETKPRSPIAPAAGRSPIAPSTAAPYSVAPGARSPIAAFWKARSPIAPFWKLLLEKLPMLAIAAFFCLVAVRGQEATALAVNRQYSLGWRTGNAAISYVAYLGQFFCPRGLAPYYPRRPVPLPPWQVAVAVLTLVSITGLAVRWRRQRAYLLVGWLWYVGMLLPVIGLVQFGAQAEADRFTYLPEIGLSIALVWAASDICRTWPRFRPIWAAAAACVLVVLIVSGRLQACYWRDSETLWTHTLACDGRNLAAHNNLGILLAQRGQLDEAIAHYQRALRINPHYVDAHMNLGVVLAKRGRLDEAIAQCQRAVEIAPDDAQGHNNLGLILAGRGRLDEAIAQYQWALQISPDLVKTHDNLGLALADRGRLDEAIAQYQQALEIQPDDAEAHNNLGLALKKNGRLGEAIAHYQRALEINPDYADAHNNLGTALARRGRTDEAMAHFRKAVEIKPDYMEARANLGAMLASQGRMDEAKEQYEKALVLARQQNKTAQAEQLTVRLKLCEAETPRPEAQQSPPSRSRPH